MSGSIMNGVTDQTPSKERVSWQTNIELIYLIVRILINEHGQRSGRSLICWPAGWDACLAECKDILGPISCRTCNEWIVLIKMPLLELGLNQTVLHDALALVQDTTNKAPPLN